MKNLKVLVFLCGGGLLGLYISAGLSFEANQLDTIIMLLAYLLPTAMGLAGLARPPMESWQGAIALSGLGVAAVRTRIWQSLPDFMDASGRGKAEMVLLVVGLIASALAMLKPERRG